MNNMSGWLLPRAPHWSIAVLLILLSASCPGSTAWAKDLRVLGIDAEKVEITVPNPSGGEQKITVSGDKDKAKTLLKTIHVGDTVEVPDATTNTVELAALKIRTVPIGAEWVLAVIVAAFVVLLYSLWLTRGHPSKSFVGTDNRLSNSKVQMNLWFGVVAIAYLATFLLRFWAGGWDFHYLGGLDIPTNLLALIGLSGVSGGGAKITTAHKDAAAERQQTAHTVSMMALEDAAAERKAEAQALAGATDGAKAAAYVRADAAAERVREARTLLKIPRKDANTKAPGLKDLKQNDEGKFDMGDVQMLLVTALAIIAFVVAMIRYWTAGIQLVAHATLPDVDIGLTALFGAGLGTYLVKKISGKPGQA
jgi:hypothetical protein